MKTGTHFLCFFMIGIVGTVAGTDLYAQASPKITLKEAESRLRAIYDRDEFRAKGFRAEWLADSSGYTVWESVPDAKEQVQARYEVASGKRTVLDPRERQGSGRSDVISPDGRSGLFSERGNLVVRDLSSDRRIVLTKNAADSAVSNGRAVWSPDGNSELLTYPLRTRVFSGFSAAEHFKNIERFWGINWPSGASL
jgi:hypothetical protein